MFFGCLNCPPAVAPTELDILASVGTSTSPTSTGNKAVTGVGFHPKLLLPFGIAVTSEGPDVNANLVFGAGTSVTSRASINVTSRSGLTNSVTFRNHDNSKVTSILSAASGTPSYVSDIDSFDADGFTLDWSTVNAFAVILNHICLGGADLEVSLTQHQMNNTNANESFAHGLSGAPTAVVFLSGINETAPPNTSTSAAISLGAWSAAGQFCSAVYAQNAQTTTKAYRILRSDSVVGYSTSIAGAPLGGNYRRFFGVSSVDATNVNCGYTSFGTTEQIRFFMLAIRGANAQVGTFDCNGSTDPLTIVCSGITPKLFLPVFVPGGVDNINAVQNGLAMTIGASDGTNTVSCGITDANGVTTTNARRYQDSGGLSEYDFDGTIESDSAVSFDGESVVLDPSTLTGSTWGQGAYLILGS